MRYYIRTWIAFFSGANVIKVTNENEFNIFKKFLDDCGVLDLLKEENGETISIDGPLTVQNLADAVGKSVSEVIMELMKMGTMATINQEVTFEVASLLAQKYGFNLEVAGSDEDVEEELEKLMQIQEDKVIFI